MRAAFGGHKLSHSCRMNLPNFTITTKVTSARLSPGSASFRPRPEGSGRVSATNAGDTGPPEKKKPSKQMEAYLALSEGEGDDQSFNKGPKLQRSRQLEALRAISGGDSDDEEEITRSPTTQSRGARGGRGAPSPPAATVKHNAPAAAAVDHDDEEEEEEEDLVSQDQGSWYLDDDDAFDWTDKAKKASSKAKDFVDSTMDESFDEEDYKQFLKALELDQQRERERELQGYFGAAFPRVKGTGPQETPDI